MIYTEKHTEWKSYMPVLWEELTNNSYVNILTDAGLVQVSAWVNIWDDSATYYCSYVDLNEDETVRDSYDLGSTNNLVEVAQFLSTRNNA